MRRNGGSAGDATSEHPQESGAPAPSVRFDKLSSSVSPSQLAFRQAQPWPHVVLDDLIDLDVARIAEADETEFARGLQPHRSHREIKAESPVPGGGAAQRILDDLLDPAFIAFVEEVTGIPRLLGDAEHIWAGLHAAPPGSYQSIHNDFTRNPISRLYHRANVMVYLNSEWLDSYGGCLELWPSDMSSCGQRIAPLLGRMVIFATNPFTLHGVPDPVSCPGDRFRLALASYYYTREAPQSSPRRHRLLQPRRPQDPWYRAFTSPAELLTGVRRRAVWALDARTKAKP